MVCLDTTRTAALVAGAMPAAQRRMAEGHLASCDRCRRLVSEAARDPSYLGRPTELGFARAGEGARRSPQPGDRVGRFLIRGVLGTGGMGVVYDAWDEQLQRAVALKQLRPRERAENASAPADATWISEARALARLHHPNVVTLYEVVPHGGVHFLALERVEGVTLRGWLRARRRTLDEILEVFLAAARGLEAAHAAGIVHSDFKPDNVLVGRDGRVRVADFGLAMSLAAGEPVMAGGTPRYVAPEQALGGPPDARCDQYSFAVALMEALSGATVATLPSSRPGPVTPLALGDLPRALWKVIARALSPSPLDRYPDFTALIAALVRARHRRQARRRLGLVAAVASVLIAASAHGAWRAHQESVLTRTRLERAREAEARRAREAVLLRASHAAAAEEAAVLRSSRARVDEEAAALRAQIASLVDELTVAESHGWQARALRRTLRQRDSQLRAMARKLAQADPAPAPIGAARTRPSWLDESPHPLVVERHVRRLAGPLQACLTDAEGKVRLPTDLGASLLITAGGTTARADVTGVEDATQRLCVGRVLAGLRIPPFDRPAVRAYVISLSWLGLEARIRVGE
jgi:eukaryotic-like serine/threonine-protein kinase